jgi:hypothetical protein
MPRKYVDNHGRPVSARFKPHSTSTPLQLTPPSQSYSFGSRTDSSRSGSSRSRSSNSRSLTSRSRSRSPRWSASSTEESTNEVTVTSVSEGVVRVHWKLPPRCTTGEGATNDFVVKCNSFQENNATRCNLSYARDLRRRKIRHSLTLSCRASSELGGQAVANVIPCAVSLEVGGKTPLALPPGPATSFATWSLDFEVSQGLTSLVLLLTFPIAHAALSQPMFNLFMSQDSGDMVFKFEDGRTCRAHTSIMQEHSLRLPPAVGLYHSTGSATHENVYHIHDDYALYAEMIRFSYVGVITDGYCTALNLSSLVDLCKLAQRYGHCRLIDHCSARITPQIVAANVLKFYTWAADSELTSLREAAVKFMASNGPEVLAQPKVLAFALAHPKKFHQMMVEIVGCPRG